MPPQATGIVVAGIGPDPGECTALRLGRRCAVRAVRSSPSMDEHTRSVSGVSWEGAFNHAQEVVMADRGRTSLPIPDRAAVGLTTYDARDPETEFPPIQPLRPPPGAPNVLLIL